MSMTRELLVMRFKKFLHYGSEKPIYIPGDRFFYKCFVLEKVSSLLKLIECDDPESILDILMKVKTDGTSLWPDAIIYAYAVIAQQKVNADLQAAAYKIIRKICTTGRDLILFVKFYSDLKGMDSRGGGSGFKRAIANWYLIWLPSDLIDILLHQRSYFGWTHADVLKIAHVKPKTKVQEVLFTYTAKGLDVAANKYGESTDQRVIQLLELISIVESFKKIKDPEEAAKQLALHMHQIERIPGYLLEYQVVWNELITYVEIETLLNNLQRLSNLGFLKNNNDTVLKLNAALTNVHRAEVFSIGNHPTKVYIEYINYEKEATYRLNLAFKMNHPISKATPSRKPPKRNILIKNALMKYFYFLYKFQKPTELRYFVAVDLRSKMFVERCLHTHHMSPVEAAQAICLSLVRTEPIDNVKVGVFVGTNGDIEILDCEKEWEIPRYESEFKSLSQRAGPAFVTKAIQWAETQKCPFDVFVVLSDFTLCSKGTRHAINKYKATMKLPTSKVVSCSLNGFISSHKQLEGQQLQVIVGFDEHTCRLIEMFARGAF